MIDYGVETPEGLVQPPPNLLTKTTVNRYLRAWGWTMSAGSDRRRRYGFRRSTATIAGSSTCSPSDLKQVPAPLWIEAGRGPPTLMLFSVVDDRSGVAYQEYRCVYGEDVAAALRFLFNAMAPKDEAGPGAAGHPGDALPGQWSGREIRHFRDVMAQLGVDVRTHMPKGSTAGA